MSLKLKGNELEIKAPRKIKTTARKIQFDLGHAWAVLLLSHCFQYLKHCDEIVQLKIVPEWKTCNSFKAVKYKT